MREGCGVGKIEKFMFIKRKITTPSINSATCIIKHSAKVSQGVSFSKNSSYQISVGRVTFTTCPVAINIWIPTREYNFVYRFFWSIALDESEFEKERTRGKDATLSLKIGGRVHPRLISVELFTNTSNRFEIFFPMVK